MKHNDRRPQGRLERPHQARDACKLTERTVGDGIAAPREVLVNHLLFIFSSNEPSPHRRWIVRLRIDF
jgi:hypothetical protein